MENNKKITNLGKLTLDVVKKLSSSKNNLVEDANLATNRTKEIDIPTSLIKPIQFDSSEEIHNFEMPDFNVLDLSFSQVKALTSEELLKLLSGEGHSGVIREPTIQLISNELLSRQIKEASKPHWTVYIGILLAFIAAITGIISLYNSN